MNKIIKPIETCYHGYRFRSRLEARWAVFFDALNLEWEYEKEGFDFGDSRYLPDFWIKTVNMWAEIKPELPFDKPARDLCVRLAEYTKKEVLMLGGVPENKPYEAITPDKYNPGFDTYEYCLTNYHNYPKEEHRFYAMPADYERTWYDTGEAVGAAKSARFEYSEGNHYNKQAKGITP